MAKYCGYCGAALPEHAKVCGMCGRPVSASKGPAAPSRQETTTQPGTESRMLECRSPENRVGAEQEAEAAASEQAANRASRKTTQPRGWKGVLRTAGPGAGGISGCFCLKILW